MKILLVQTGFLGDIILTSPTISGVHVKHPDAEIWMLTTPAGRELLKNDPLLSGIIVFDKHKGDNSLKGFFAKIREVREHNFDIVYSVHRSPRTVLLLYLANIPSRIGFANAKLRFLYTELRERPLECHDVIRNLALLFPKNEVPESVQDLRLFCSESKYADKKYAVLFPGSAWKTKRWSSKGYRAVAKYLLSTGYAVKLLGDSRERLFTDEIASGIEVENLAGKLSLQESMATVKDASLVVCNDSMALHLASTFKIPTVAIFCATSPSFGFGPWRNNALVVENTELACKPCRRHGSNQCPTGTELCMSSGLIDKVIGAIKVVTCQH